MVTANEKQRVVDRLLGNKKIEEYHVFADNVDDWFDSYDKALKAYNRLCKDHDNVRMYAKYVNKENGDMEGEDCLKAKGEFPI